MKDWLLGFLFGFFALLIAAVAAAGPFAAGFYLAPGVGIGLALLAAIAFCIWWAGLAPAAPGPPRLLDHFGPFVFGGLAVGVAAILCLMFWRAIT